MDRVDISRGLNNWYFSVQEIEIKKTPLKAGFLNTMLVARIIGERRSPQLDL